MIPCTLLRSSYRSSYQIFSLSSSTSSSLFSFPLLPSLSLSLPSLPSRLYHESVIDQFDNPRNVGKLDPKSPSVGTGVVGAPACGDVMKIQIDVSDDGVVRDVKFKTFGCGSAIASSSYTTEWVKGKHVDDVVKLKNSDIAKHLSLPPVKLHCSMLAEDAVKAAVKDWRTKQENIKKIQGQGEKNNQNENIKQNA